MKSLFPLLQINLYLTEYKFALFCFVTAFVITLITIPPIILLIRKYKLYDVPDHRKEHAMPVPTMGGIAIMAGMMAALLFWFPFSNELALIYFFFSIAVLFVLGIMDDLRDLSARYKFIIEIGLATLIALSGIRITSFEGLFGITDLSTSAQYTVTIVAIVGITNAFNLIDGIDGLAGGLGFMSLMILGLFLTILQDANTALVAFALAGALLAFLYYNFNPARIFMGDTGSLVLGFVIAVLCIRLLEVNFASVNPLLNHAPVFITGIVMIPVFDTVRVFSIRIWNGKSPFVADRIHIHHILTNAGFSHLFASRLICFVHGIVLLQCYLLRDLRPELSIAILSLFMLLVCYAFKQMGIWKKRQALQQDNAAWQSNIPAGNGTSPTKE